MSTRGYMGLKKDGELKGMYNHFDSYPSGLGKYLIEELNKINVDERVKKLNEAFDYIELVDEDKKPTKKQKEDCIKAGVTNFSVASRSEDDWYCLLREAQGEIGLYINKVIPYMINGNSFIEDTLFCEWYYIINLDTLRFEVFENDYTNRRGVKRGEFDLLDLKEEYLQDIENYY